MDDTAEAQTSGLAYGPTEWDDHHHLPTNTGLTNEKVTMWAFLGSDCLLFGALISTYLLCRNRIGPATKGPTAADLFDIPFTSVSSFVLLMSSLTMVLAVTSIQRAGNNDQHLVLSVLYPHRLSRSACFPWHRHAGHHVGACHARQLRSRTSGNY